MVAAVDPHRKFYTRWDEVNEAIQRRNDFYRALLTPDEVREARAVAAREKLNAQQTQAVRLIASMISRILAATGLAAHFLCLRVTKSLTSAETRSQIRKM